MESDLEMYAPSQTAAANEIKNYITWALWVFLIAAIVEGLMGLSSIISALTLPSWAWGFHTGYIMSGIIDFVWAGISLMSYVMVRSKVLPLAEAGRWAEMRSGMVVWIILGFLFGFVIAGILLLLAYMRAGELISTPVTAPLPPSPTPVSTATAVPPPPPTSSKPEEKLCPKCGKPLTYIKEYNRWYCYNCKQYV